MSRRHALIVRQPDGLRVLDDRSLNGVFVNGERVEWSTLADGDEVVIGRHRLYFVDLPVDLGRALPPRATELGRDRLTRDPARRRSSSGRRLALAYSRAPMAATIAVLSQKGGTGKTTAVRTLTDVFRRIDLRVLAVDLDPQGNLSDYLDVDPEASPTIGDVLAGRAKRARGGPRRDHPREPRARRGRADRSAARWAASWR